MRTRWGTSAAALLATAGLAMLAGETPWSGPSAAGRIESLDPDLWYAIDVAGEEATIDLPFDEGSRHMLIVGSLAPFDQRANVELSAEPASAAGAIFGRAVEPLEVPISHRGPKSEDDVRARLGRKAVARGIAPVATEAGRDSATRTFHLHVTEGPLDDPRHYARVAARPIAEGRTVRVHLDRSIAARDLYPGLADEIVRLMDEDVVPRTARTLGTHRDVDGDGKFAVLLTPWLERLLGGRTSLGGLVRGDDFRADRDAPFGNRSDLMFLNSHIRADSHLRSLLLHEYAHAVCFSARLGSDAAPLPLPPEEDWVNEAIAHVSERLHDGGWANLDHRISRFLDDPASHPLVVPNYYSAGLWRDHGCRGATYLFLQWCADRFGPEFPRRLARGPYSGTRNLEHVTGVPFEELYRRWTIAVFEAGRAAPPSAALVEPEGYRELDLRAPLSGWGLCGPRTVSWDVDGAGRSLDLRGTATAFVELRATGTAGPRRVRIRATPGTRLQVSLRTVSGGPADVRLAARWLEPGEGSSLGCSLDHARQDAAPRRAVLVEATADHRAGARGPFEVEFISCEINRGENSRSLCVAGDALSRAQIARDPSRHASAWRIELPPRFPFGPEDALTVKAVMRDESGRRATARAAVRPAGAELAHRTR